MEGCEQTRVIFSRPLLLLCTLVGDAVERAGCVHSVGTSAQRERGRGRGQVRRVRTFTKLRRSGDGHGRLSGLLR
jgi:hypothetical protein